MESCGPNSKASCEKIISIIAAAACAFVYVIYSFPFPDWLDSPELITASVRLGTFHPPGSPLAVLLGHVISLLPFGHPGQGMMFFSAIWAAASIYVISRINQHLWRNLAPGANRCGEMIAAPAMAVVIGLSPGLLSQAVRTEVYTLGLLLALLVLFQAMRIFTTESFSEIKKAVYQASLYTGMGIAVHPLVALVPLPVLLFASLRSKLRSKLLAPGKIGRAFLLFLLGATPLAFIGFMVHGWADVRWGDPTSFSGWLNFISGATFSHTFSGGPTSFASNIYNVFLLLITETGWPLLILGMLGIYALLRSSMHLAAGLLITMAAAFVPLLIERSFRLDNPDVSGYALLAFVSVGLFSNISWIMIAGVLHPLRKHAYLIVSILSVLMCLHTLLFLAPKENRSQCNCSETMVTRTLHELPKASVVLCADFNLVFMLDYLTKVRNIRPDATILFLRDLDNSALRSRLSSIRPDIVKHLPPDSNLTAAGVLKFAEAVPLAMDLGPHFPADESLMPIRPFGLLWQIKALQNHTDEEMLSLQKRIFKNIKLTCNASKDARTANVLAWHAYFQAVAAQHLKLPGLARYMLGIARQANPQDKTISAAFRMINR